MTEGINKRADTYKSLLKDYIETLDEKTLYQAEQLSKIFIKNTVLPDEIVNYHNKALTEIFPDLSTDIQNSMHFLLETMISYGLAMQELQVLREKQFQLHSEIAVAASMQETLLATTVPEIEGLEIGAISVPAEQMNGDYHHFVKGRDGSLGIAIADVIGKGVPAALCMSMIKYSMDSFPVNSMNPATILGSLNRVVERNVDSSMFITMLTANYDPVSHLFKYASAGHEPGFHYHAQEGKFTEIPSGGLVLGVLPETVYEQQELEVARGDMVVLLTDGVTECRRGDRFIESEEVLAVIDRYAHLGAQALVENVYKHFERMQDFELKDDFTLIILRRKV